MCFGIFIPIKYSLIKFCTEISFVRKTIHISINSLLYNLHVFEFCLVPKVPFTCSLTIHTYLKMSLKLDDINKSINIQPKYWSRKIPTGNFIEVKQQNSVE